MKGAGRSGHALAMRAADPRHHRRSAVGTALRMLEKRDDAGSTARPRPERHTRTSTTGTGGTYADDH